MVNIKPKPNATPLIGKSECVEEFHKLLFTLVYTFGDAVHQYAFVGIKYVIKIPTTIGQYFKICY